MLLLAVVVYNLPNGTVSLCLAVDSARIRLSGVRLRRPDMYGTRCQMILEIGTVSIV